ncbi:RTA1 like protein-domain-containing protein [Thelonectria olida]|uniref:RTA1 like protein-domain-containing protein n=1 Tax=Thelonectria olida TaxID=1576542 RepID=A0A9P8VW79_9HYPO|nr:RTA1 like protein-domain-containing protein [Thelonectria olida]
METQPIPRADTGFKFYHYNPSTAGNAIFAGLFAVISIAHLWLIIKSRGWYFIPFLVGCIFEAVGYVGRVISSNETPNWTLNPYLVQTLLLLMGPTLYAASIYMVLGRLVRSLDAAHHSIIRVNWLTKVFLMGDILSICGQGGGGGMMASAKTSGALDTANNIVILGLGIQIIFFSLFIVTTILFHIRIRRVPTSQSLITTSPWEQFIWVLYVSSVLILIRSIFRVGEFALGNGNELQLREIYIFVLDAIPILAVAMAFAWFHPCNILDSYKKLGKGMGIESNSEDYMMGNMDGYRS